MKKIFISTFLIILILLSNIILFAQPLGSSNLESLHKQLQVARRFERMKNYTQALDIYQTLDRQYPNNEQVFDGIQRCYLALKMYDKQINMLRQKLAENPKSVAVHEWLGTALVRSGEEEQGKQYWEDIIAMKPDNLENYKLVATLYYRNGMIDEAVATYQNAREIAGDKSLYALDMARIYEFQMNYSEAIDEYLKHLSGNKKRFNYISSKIIKLCEKEGIWAVAIAKIQEELAQSPKYYELHNLLGDIYLRSGKPELGLEQYLLFVEKSNSKDGRSLFQYAQRCEDEGEFAVAVSAYNALIERVPASPFRDKSILQKGSALTSLARYDEALQTYQTFVDEEKSKRSHYVADAYLGIGDIYLYHLKQPGKALEAYDKLTKFPGKRDRFTVYFRIADVFFVQDKFDQAKEQYQKIQKMASGNSLVDEEAYYKLANLELLQGNLDTAGKLLTEMLKKYPDGKYINDALNWSIFINENQQAKEDMQQYLQGLLYHKQMKYELAISEFQQIITNASASPLADDALLQLAEVHKDISDYQKALDNYQKLMEEYPDSELAAEAQMKMGDLYSEGMDDYSSAKIAYEKVILEYPESLQADLVRKKLQKISGKIQ